MYVERTWSCSWEHDKSLNKGQQDLTKLNTITSSLCRRLETCKMLYLALVGIAHQMRSMWYYGFITFCIKTNSPSALNRNGRISKSELYHNSQQFSQHDCPIKIFYHKHKYMYMEQTLCKLLFQKCYDHVTFWNFERSVVYKIAWRHSWFVEFNFSYQDYVCLNSRI